MVGAEICPLAVEAFFAESGLHASVTKHGAFSIYQTEGLWLYCGDFFQLTSEDIAGVSSVFDRASLIAVPPSMKHRRCVAFSRRIFQAEPLPIFCPPWVGLCAAFGVDVTKLLPWEW